MECLNQEKLPLEVKRKFVSYLEQMLNTHGDNLISAAVYGSAAGFNYASKISDINSVFIFREISFTTLKNSLKIVNKGISLKIAAPLFLTKEYIQASLDVFPVEFLEMKENHVLLYGEDILAKLKIEGKYVRLFCEQQIKGKLIRIRQAYLEVGLKRKGREALLKGSLQVLLPIFRNLLRLKGLQSPVDKIDVLRLLCREFSLEENVFLSIYRDARDDEKIAHQNVETFLEKYIGQIEKLAICLDKI